MFTLRDALRWLHGGDAKTKPGFASEKEAYDFCRNLYKKSGGVTPELRKSFEFYTKHLNDDCREFVGPVEPSHPALTASPSADAGHAEPGEPPSRSQMD